MDDVISYLLNYAFENDIGFIKSNRSDSSWPSVSIPERNIIFINMNWANQNEIPFIIAHEIGHMINLDSCHLYNTTNASMLKIERNADVFAIGLLVKYCKDYDIEFEDPSIFIQQFSIPSDLMPFVLQSSFK